MSRSDLHPAPPAAQPPRRPARRSRTSVFWLSLPLVVVAGLVLVLPLTGLLPDTGQDLAATRRPPAFLDGGTWAHPLGTDKLGQDVLTQFVSAGRLTILIGLVGALVAIGPGTLLGVLAGYFRGWVDRVISVLIDAQLALPFILVALAIISNRGSSLPVLFLVLALTGWAVCARVTRSATLAIRERQFVTGLRAAGASEARIVFRHVLPNLAGTVVALGTLQVGTAILIESALSFLGLGVPPPSVSWGSMLASGQDELSQAWWIALFPGLAITLLVLLVNLLGDALLTHHDPRKRRR
ncbi:MULTISPECIES: ABC transporter permease [unclassified Solwaraspora]|uniref:ABC transporter permease n=1 Tax=unclassified Solwaraspora TaxID=2627926 RepID=UPI00248B990F|nr:MULTISPECIES: ABC transporter permease [unclassified Solwaraspora]WBB99878.1 ABC transporter permease [Solwaraspora sp. WMMA2059]WBC21574.1 ABC transporter permease [Solwaraspora sp. WMMA2080]WJK36389.1 ABC transporter permease [Solwaraspora sp. WMMA2065]